MLTERFNSVIPNDIKTLMELPGVGQKTANVIASIIYNIPALAVDTHVFRVSHRLGLAKGKDPLATEKELEKSFRVKSGVTRITGLSGMGAKSARLASRCAVAAWLWRNARSKRKTLSKAVVACA